MKTIALLLGMMFGVSSCGKNNSSSPPITLEDGEYVVTGPVCKSTSESPVYPNAGASAALYHFTDAEYKITISGLSFIQVFTDEDCKLTMERELSANNAGLVGIREKTITSSDPENCELSVVHDDTTFPFTSADPILKSNDTASVEILYEVESSEEAHYTMSSRNEEPDNSAWASFGCADSDQIVYSLVKN